VGDIGLNNLYGVNGTQKKTVRERDRFGEGQKSLVDKKGSVRMGRSGHQRTRNGCNANLWGQGLEGRK